MFTKKKGGVGLPAISLQGLPYFILLRIQLPINKGGVISGALLHLEHFRSGSIQFFHIKEGIFPTGDGIWKGFSVDYVLEFTRGPVIDNSPTVVLNGVISNIKHSPKNPNSRFSAKLFAPNHEADNKKPTIGLDLGRMNFIAT